MIDGDVLAYRFAAGAEHPIRWQDNLWTYQADALEGRGNLDMFLERIFETIQCWDFTIYLTGRGNFRSDIWPDYKANRKGKRKPILHGDLFTYMVEYYGAKVSEGCEADDLIGRGGWRRKDRVMCTIDKDLRTIEGNHFNWDKPDEGVVRVNARQAAYNFYTQVLVGDHVDNFPGLPSCGPKTAEKLLKDCKTPRSMWSAVVSAYEAKSLTANDARTQARCAYILKTKRDIDKKGRIRLWTPPTGKLLKTG